MKAPAITAASSRSRTSATSKRELKPGERPLIGAPSKYQFRVTGLEAGTVKLVFTYVKGRDTPPAKTQEVTVEVVGE